MRKIKMLIIASLFVALLFIASLALLPILPAAPFFAQPSGTLSSTPPNPIVGQFVPNHVTWRVADFENSVRGYQNVTAKAQSNVAQPQTEPLQAAMPPWVKPPAQDGSMNWFGSRYGPSDEIGAANLLTAEVVHRAVGLVTQGKTYALGMEFNSKTPGYPPRHIDHYLLENIGSDHSNLDDIVTRP